MDRVSTATAAQDGCGSRVSIPRSGWIVFQHGKVTAPYIRAAVFQSLVRDGSCFNPMYSIARITDGCFNPSFGMDRVSTPAFARQLIKDKGFNPSFGMDRVSTRGANLSNADLIVSIPRSGWIVFQRYVHYDQCVMEGFQSLVRDGSCFNATSSNKRACNSAVSIPRSGWIVFQRDRHGSKWPSWPVSIPRSGWIVFQHRSGVDRRNRDACFNPSFGMDRVSTSVWRLGRLPGTRFNPSFGMDRVSTSGANLRNADLRVSIPRSGWIVFQPGKTLF